jgi:hypothetical protein
MTMPTHRRALRASVTVLAALAVSTAGIAWADTSTAATIGHASPASGLLPPPFEALNPPLDDATNPLLAPVLGPYLNPDHRSDGTDTTELNLNCDPATGSCTRVPDSPAHAVEPCTNVPCSLDPEPGWTVHNPDGTWSPPDAKPAAATRIGTAAHIHRG